MLFINMIFKKFAKKVKVVLQSFETFFEIIENLWINMLIK